MLVSLHVHITELNIAVHSFVLATESNQIAVIWAGVSHLTSLLISIIASVHQTLISFRQPWDRGVQFGVGFGFHAHNILWQPSKRL